MAHWIHIVDVFAERAYAGNPLAVVVDADDLSEQTMQQLAAEMNYSETTFVASAPDDHGGYRVRIFTPAREILFAGHPLLGTAWVIRHHVARQLSDSVRINLAVGQVPVTFEASQGGADIAWFVGPKAEFGVPFDRAQFAAVLGLSTDDIEPTAPVQQLIGGASAIIVPLCGLDALRRSRLDLQAFGAVAKGIQPLVYLFCRETYGAQNDLCARFFFEAHGVREDPATGFGAALLGAYLLEHPLVPGDDLSLRIEQGYEMRRPSLVMLRARTVNGRSEVRVGGNVIPIVQGHLLE